MLSGVHGRRRRRGDDERGAVCVDDQLGHLREAIVGVVGFLLTGLSLQDDERGSGQLAAVVGGAVKSVSGGGGVLRRIGAAALGIADQARLSDESTDVQVVGLGAHVVVAGGGGGQTLLSTDWVRMSRLDGTAPRSFPTA